MHKRVTFQNMPHSAAIEEYVHEQLAKIEEFLEQSERTPIHIDMVIQAAKVHAHPRVELRIKTPHYNEVTHCEKAGVDIPEAVKHVVDVMYRTLHNAKKKRMDHRKNNGRDRE